jgi:hypothetical protein
MRRSKGEEGMGRGGWWALLVVAAVWLTGSVGSEAVVTSQAAVESQCMKEGNGAWLGVLVLLVAPTLLNVLCLGVLAASLSRVRGMQRPADEVFQAAMLLTKTALKVAVPAAAVDAIHKLIPEPCLALKERLTKENAEQQKKNRGEE